MAETFLRKPIPGGDLDSWAPLNDNQLLRTLGLNSGYLYNDGGALKLSTGQIGMDDGTNKGTITIGAIKTISLAGLTDNLWAKVELSVGGSSVTTEITSMVGENNESLIPASVKAAYNGLKAGYYITATKRLIGFVFIRTSTTLGRIVNCENGKFGFQGIRISDHMIVSGAYTRKYYDTIKILTAAWNMDTGATYSFSYPFTGMVKSCIFKMEAIITQNGGAFTGYKYTLLLAGRVTAATGGIILERNAGSIFDAADFNAAVAEVDIEYET